jgi:hypothetical protein
MTAFYHDVDDNNPFIQAIRGYQETERQFLSNTKNKCTDDSNCRQTKLTDFGFTEGV